MKKEKEIYSALTDNLILKFLTFFNLNCRYLINIFQAEPEFSHGHVLMQQVTIIWQVKSLFSQQYLHSTFSILCFIFLFLSSAIRNLVKPVLFLYSKKCVHGNFTKLFDLSCLMSCLTLGDPMDLYPPDSSVHGIIQTRILEWVAMLFYRESSQPRDWTWVSCIASILFLLLYEPPGKPHVYGENVLSCSVVSNSLRPHGW